jgi:hypothetical protein
MPIPRSLRIPVQRMPRGSAFAPGLPSASSRGSGLSGSTPGPAGGGNFEWGQWYEPPCRFDTPEFE